LRVAFGLRPALIFASAISAELGKYARVLLKIPIMWIMDDFLSKGKSFEEANLIMDLFEELIYSLGLMCVREKRLVIIPPLCRHYLQHIENGNDNGT